MPQKLCLQLIPVSSPIEMIESIIHRLDQKNDIQLLGKIIFPAMVWNVWQERNGRIFQQTNLNVATVEREFPTQVHSRIVYLGIQLPDDIGSHWDLPPDRPINKTSCRHLFTKRLAYYDCQIISMDSGHLLDPFKPSMSCNFFRGE